MAGVISYPRTVGNSQNQRKLQQLQSIVSRLESLLTSGNVGDLMSLINQVGWGNIPGHLIQRIYGLLVNAGTNVTNNHIAGLIYEDVIQFAHQIYNIDDNYDDDFFKFINDRCSFEFEEIVTDTKKIKNKLDVQVITTYRVKSKDTLQKIADSELGSATKWKMIAVANGIDNPNDLEVGMQLTIPSED